MDFSRFWFSGQADDTIGNSLRFRGAQWLGRNFASTPSTFTQSAWIKRADFGNIQRIFGARAAGSVAGSISFTTDDEIEVSSINPFIDIFSNGVYRDPAAWMHVVVATDGTDTTAYVNGTQVVTANQAFLLWHSSANGNSIGRDGDVSATFFEGHLAEVHFIDGTELDPTDFGEFNTDGVWVPKTVSGVTYGTNGFYLDFSDPANIGADRSGNNNNWTPNGFELTTTTSTNYDLMEDSPSQNFSTWNPLTPQTGTWEDANLTYRTPNVDNTSSGTMAFNSSDGNNYYVEFTLTIQNATSVGLIGVENNDLDGSLLINQPVSAVYSSNGFIRQNGTVLASGLTNAGSGDVIGCKITGSTRNVEFSVNGTALATTVTLPADTDFMLASGDNTGAFASGNSLIHLNAGQQPFQNQPANFSALQTKNLPSAGISLGTDHFRALTGTGANILNIAQGTNNSGTNWNDSVNTGFANGLWWIKDRDNADQHQLVDSVRGGNLALQCPSAPAETAYSAPSGNSVAWCWNAPDAFTPTVTNMTNPSGRRNVAAGFSIVATTGTNTNPATFSHGLNSQPEFIIAKSRDTAAGSSGNLGFPVYHKHLGVTTSSALYLNNDNNINNRGATTFDLSVSGDVTVGTFGDLSSNGQDYVYYCWHSVPGYSAFGEYVGNGDVDGPFIYTGFRPAFILHKVASNTASWKNVDTTRSAFNPEEQLLFPDRNIAEASNASFLVDFLSNGFKIRLNNLTSNANGETYIYAAFAENPFGGSNVSPANAR